MRAGKLIILNGPPASGKSTIARMYADKHPSCLLLDIDDIRSLLSDSSDQTRESGLAARRQATSRAKEHLSQGKDVVVAQAYGVEKFLEEWEELAKEVDADFYEFMLTLDKEDMIRRYSARDGESELAVHRDSPSRVEELAEKVERVREVRNPKTIKQVEGKPEESYQDFLRQLS